MDEQRRFPVRLSHLLIGFSVAALSACVYQGRTGIACLLAWLMYTAGLIYVMSRFKWSDIAMSVCFLLIVLLPPLIIIIIFPPLW
jgi:hypothetical protein